MKNYSAEQCIICNTKLIGNSEHKYCTCDDYSVDLMDNGKKIAHVMIDFDYKDNKYSVQVSYRKNFYVVSARDSEDTHYNWGEVHSAKGTLDLSIDEWKKLIDKVLNLKAFK